MFSGIDFNINGLTNNMKNNIKAQFFIDNANITYHKYLNIPVSIGINYNLKANNKISLFGNASMTSNFLKITDFLIEIDSNIISKKFDLATNFGYKLGCGILINKKIILEINYNSLGKHEVEGELEVLGEAVEIEAIELKLDFLTLTAGFKF